MKGALPNRSGSEVRTGCLIQRMAGRHVLSTGRSGQAMAWPSITGHNVSHNQSSIATSAKSLGLITTKRDEVMSRADSDIVKCICRSCTLSSEAGHRINLGNKGK